MKETTDKLKALKNEELIDVVKNYRQYQFDQTLRNYALKLLEDRGVGIENLKQSGNFENKTYQVALKHLNNFQINAKKAFIFQIAVIISFIVVLLGYWIPYSYIGLLVTPIAFILFYVFLIRSYFDRENFYKTIGQKMIFSQNGLARLFLGDLTYMGSYHYYLSKMKDEMEMIR